MSQLHEATTLAQSDRTCACDARIHMARIADACHKYAAGPELAKTTCMTGPSIYQGLASAACLLGWSNQVNTTCKTCHM